MVIASVGISACGKTRYGNELKKKMPNLKIICPDDVRETFGDISDQNNNFKVFKIVNEQLEEAMKNNETIYYSATNLTKNSRKELMRLCKKYNQEFVAVVFLTSWRPDICEDRCRRDLAHGVVRSNTIVKDENGKTIIRKQFEKWATMMKSISLFEKELEENTSKYIIKYIECQAS